MLDRLLARRNSWPRFVNALIDGLADRPMSIIGRLAALRYGSPSKQDETPVLVPDGQHTVSVLIGPVNYASQGRLWAQSLEEADDQVQAVNLAVDVPGGFDFPSDAVIPVPTYQNGKAWQQAQFEAARRFSHVLIEAEEPLFGRYLGRDVEREFRALQSSGVSVAFMGHGTDVRLPSSHRERTPWSPYRDPALYVNRLETLARRNQALLTGSGRPMFVSTPDLLDDLPTAVWCPVVVDPAHWAIPRHASRDGRLRVVHAPSSALVKGTHLIEPVLHSLHQRGAIDYRPISGVPAHAMRDVYADADVVLDQFRLGAYGVAACEAMAAGRLVVGHVLQSVRDRVEKETGLQLPVAEATPDTLEELLLSVAADREAWIAKAGEGPAFVEQVHDGRLSSEILISHWIAGPRDLQNKDVSGAGV
ncbi:MAG: hypothetical protein IR160_12905 [Salinibacterium sp.]|nr:hypothetical protein [Salinibacterium sp.]MBF0673473.1 hypothetical protein [Salinibacterium sp.]